MDIKIREPKSTPTRIVRELPTSERTRPGTEINRIWSSSEPVAGSGWTFDIPVPEGPPEEALLNVVMTFGGGVVRMEAVDIGVSAEGSNAPGVYGRLIDAVKAYLEASGDERAELLRYTPDDWFRFVPPDQANTRECRKTLAERLDDAYRDDALTLEEKGLLDDAANQFGSRLSHEG